MRQPPEALLLDWIRRQRWSAPPLPTGTEGLVEVADAEVADGLQVAWWMLPLGGDAGDALLLPMACCRGAVPVPDAVRSGGWSWFDALAHPTTAAHALGMLDAQGRRGLEAVWLDAEPLRLDGVRPLAPDQSNTTVRTAGHALKVFRKIRPGRNPEIELGAALRERRSAHTAPLSGWASLTTARGTYDVLAVHRWLDGEDGFALAVADAERSATGRPQQHFPGAAYELGIALGAVHAELAEAFGERLVDGYAAELSQRLLRRLAALRDVPQLQPYLSAAQSLFTDLAALRLPAVVHRIHGDLHLGQTLFTEDGWRLIDFEGEPRRPLAERAAPDSPMRDVAGMLRSFDYAARWSPAAADDAPQWVRAATDLLLEGYRLQRPHAVLPELLHALTLDKALYEVGYEAAYRPERVRIPLTAVAALCPGG